MTKLKKKHYLEKNICFDPNKLGEGVKVGPCTGEEDKSDREKKVLLRLGGYEGLCVVGLVVWISAEMKCTYGKKKSLLWSLDENSAPVNL